jgi:putative hydrolase of the HAD superfamily
MTTEPIEAIGFDLFNTLITMRKQALEDAFDRLFKSLEKSGLSIDFERFTEDHRNAARRFLEKTREDGRETHNRFWIQEALSMQGFELSSDDERIAGAYEAYFTAFLDHVDLVPSTLEMLEYLSRKYHIGLLSNFTHAPAARAILDTTGLGPFFPVQAISGEIGYRKPHPVAFQELVNGLGIESGKILYVGDDLEPDVYGAIDNGLRPVWTTYVMDHGLSFAPGYADREEELPGDHVPRISEWSDLIALLEGDC